MKANVGREGPILIAVDFSADSKAALVWGCDEALKWKAPVTVLHVVHDPGDAPGYYRKAPDEAVLPIRDVAEEMMKEFLDNARKDIRAFAKLEQKRLKTKLVTGLPASRIIEVAEKIGASSIVMGSRGQTGLKYLFLGSKAERVVQLAEIPVTIVKGQKPKR
jgi:nucleotide-binding universal stress UspA family protein